MAKRTSSKRSRRNRPGAELDELGGRADGGLSIIDAAGTTVHSTPARVAAAMRYLVARVQVKDADGLPAVVALTSAVLGEGVTYVTRSLAGVLSYDTTRTAVIADLTWRRPPATDDGEHPGGLAAVVEGQANLDDVIISTSNPRLSLVPAGGLALARRPAVAAGDEIATVVDDLASRFDHVFLDLPPVLMSSDAIQLAQLSDAFMLVVRQGSTPQAQVSSAFEELSGIESLGVVINRFDTKIPRRLRRLVGT